MTSFDKKLKKLIAQFAIENNYEFFRPQKRRNYVFKSVDKFIPDDETLNKNSFSPYEELESIYKLNNNWIINQGANKLFTYLMKDSSIEFKLELCLHYNKFSNFKSIMDYLINNKEIDIVKEFFISARSYKIYDDKFRSSVEESILIDKIFSIYSDKKEFLKDLPLYLKHQAEHYNDGWDKENKQFMLYNFLNNNYSDKLLLEPILKLLPEKPLESVDDFIEVPTYKTEIIRINRKKFMSSFSIENAKSYNLASSYEKILSYVEDFLNEEFSEYGVSKCFKLHNEEINKNNEYIVLAVILEAGHSMEMLEINKIIIKETSLYLARNGEILDDKDLVKEALTEFKSILLKERLSEELAPKLKSKVKKI